MNYSLAKGERHGWSWHGIYMYMRNDLSLSGRRKPSSFKAPR